MSQHSQGGAWIGRLVGDRYRLDQRLGGGGMGDVFLATDTRLGKPVALKLLKEALAIAANLDLKARFERECAICAALKSVHIVQVSDYGVTAEGYPFYVMEHLQGQTLGQLLAGQPRLSVEQTCNIITQVCAGLHAAHAGVMMWNRETNSSDRIRVVHRDLKPDNIFLTPTALGEFVKIIDFGIAKISSLQAEYTVTNLFLGTCHYASPEQSEGGEIDERSDIYSLGVILYEMLAGIDPFGLDFRKNRITNNAWLAAHAFKPPQPLRSTVAGISAQLEAVVMRCLAKSPSDRFASVTDLRMALQAAVATSDRPGDRDDSSATVTAVWQPAPAPEPSTVVSPALPPPPTQLHSAPRARQPLWGVVGGIALALAIGTYAVPQLLTAEILPLPARAHRQLALAESIAGGDRAVWAAVLTQSGTLISAGEDRDAAQQFPIKLWDAQTQQVRQTLNGHTGAVRSLSLSGDERRLASGSSDRTIKVWDVATGSLIQTLAGHAAPVTSVALSRDGETLISGSEDQTVRIWHLKTGQSQTLAAHAGAVLAVAISPDQQTIASGSADKTIRLWDGATGELIRTLGEPGGHRDAINAIAFSPDGAQLASAGSDGFVKLWTATGQLLQTLEGHTDRAVSVAFVGESIASASFDHTIRVWEAETGRALQTLAAHESRVLSVSSRDRTLVSSSSDTTIKIWR